MSKNKNEASQQNQQQNDAKNASIPDTEFGNEFVDGPEQNQKAQKMRKQQRKRRNEPKGAQQANDQ